MKKYYELIFRLWKLLKPFHRHFYLQFFLNLLQQGIQVYLVVLTAQNLNYIVEGNFKMSGTILMIWLFFRLLKVVISYIADQNVIKNIENSIQQYLEEYSFKKIFKLNASQYIEDHSAVKKQVIDRGENAVENIISTITLTLIPIFTQIAFAIIAIGWYSPLSASICLLVFLITFVWTNIFTNFHRSFTKKNMENWDEQRKIRSEAFQHLSLIKVSGTESLYLYKYLKNRLSLIDFTIFTWKTGNLHSKRKEVFLVLGRTLITFIVIKQVVAGFLKIGSVYAIWSWMNDSFNSMDSVTKAMRQIPIRFVELEKYLDIIDKEPEFEESGIKKFKMGNIVLTNVSFKYPKGEDSVFENLNLTIEEGKKTAFVGFSGSGKSTITKLLLRIYDWSEGDIKMVHKKKSVGLREIDAKTFRQKIGYVEQHVDLFDTTIRENILFGIDESQIPKKQLTYKLNQAIKKSRIDQFFHRLGESGLDTIIGERGVKLSGGERQRIGIARALIKDPEILIFDEATASLDTENEKFIQEAIDESSKGRTTIIIAHRLSTVQNADKIFVLDKGKIVGEGTHEELKTNCEEYQRLIHAQNT